MASHYIRAGASGANDGSSWADAWTTFAAMGTPVRGDTYYIAGGTYNETVYINVNRSGTTWIYFKKANAADNSGDPGWNQSYADTVATITKIGLDKGYVSFDGVTGSGTSGHGIHVLNPGTGDNQYAVQLEDVAFPFSLSRLDIEGAGFASGTGGTIGIYANNASAPTKNIYVGYCWVHEVTTNGVLFTSFQGTSYSDYGLLFENNVVSETGGCTDPDKHGQGMQLGLGSGVNYCIIRNNIFRNNLGSAVIAFLTGTNNLSYTNIRIYNNIFYSTDSVVYTANPGVIWWEGKHEPTNYTNMVMSDLSILNNVFYNISCAAVILGQGGPEETVTNTLIQNCIFETCNFPGAVFQITNQSNNGYYSNIGASVPSGTTNQVDGSSTTFVNAPAYNFHLATGGYAVGAGLDLSATFTTDADGATRTVPWTLGAYIYGAGLTVLKRLGRCIKLFGQAPA